MSTNFRLSGEHVQKNVAFGSNRDRIQKEMDRNAEEKATLGNEVKEFQNMKVDLQNLQV
jgi:hypothetical protein